MYPRVSLSLTGPWETVLFQSHPDLYQIWTWWILHHEHPGRISYKTLIWTAFVHPKSRFRALSALSKLMNIQQQQQWGRSASQWSCCFPTSKSCWLDLQWPWFSSPICGLLNQDLITTQEAATSFSEGLTNHLHNYNDWGMNEANSAANTRMWP